MSDAGTAAWELADSHANAFETGAAERDRSGAFDPELVAAVRHSGMAGAAIPVELGGLGVTQVRDLMAVVARLAHADGSMAIVAQMHLGGTWSLSRAWRAGMGGQALTDLLAGIGRGEVWLASAVTEAGTNFFHPRTTLRAVPPGWLVDGVKVFATGSLAATHLNTNARVVGGAYDGRLANIYVPATTAGVTIIDDWDGLGMRSSGSGQVRFEACELGSSALVLPGGPYGEFTPAALVGRAMGNLGNVAAIVGVAEAARDLAVARARSEGRVSETPLGERATVRHSLAELETDLYAATAALARVAGWADELASQPPPSHAVAQEFMAAFQMAKLIVNRSALAVTDRAMTLCGGSGYLGGHPAARFARDARAGQFMQPFSPHEALGFIGAIVAGTDPDVEA